MRIDVAKANAFYDGPLGRAVAGALSARVGALWDAERLGRVLGVGYAPPVLDPLLSRAERVCWAAPAESGAHMWPSAKANASFLIEETHLPFRSDLFDKVILLHALEEASAPAPLMRDVRRVLAPEGRLILIVTRRLSLWSAFESTPFGRGRPFSMTQLRELLDMAMFQPVASSRALYFPPIGFSPILRRTAQWERAGAMAAPWAAGAFLVEAVKRVAAKPRQGSAAAPAFVRAPALGAAAGVRRARTLTTGSRGASRSTMKEDDA